MAITMEQLQALCSTDKDTRWAIGAPFMAGAWAVATDGRGLIATKGLTVEGRKGHPDATDLLADPTGTLVRATVALLKAFCSERKPKRPDCEMCHGTEIATCGWCEDGEPETECPDCHGLGTLLCPECKPGTQPATILGAVFNRALIERYIEPLAAHEVVGLSRLTVDGLADEWAPLVVDAGDVRVVVMPMRWDESCGSAPELKA